MTFVINSPIDAQTGKPTGRSWRTGFKVNSFKTQHKRYKETYMDNELKRNAEGIVYKSRDGVIPLAANGDAELIFKVNTDEIGQRQLWNRVQAALDQLMSSEHDLVILKELYDSYLVYELGNKLYKRSYTLDEDNQVTLGNDVVEVREERTFEPISPTASQAAMHVKPMSALGFNFGR